jgi:hypothetical protein
MQGVVIAAMVGIIGMPVSTFAERNKITVTGPGFKMEKKRGLFGRESSSYSDALGNSYSHKDGWFRDTTESSLFGSRVTQRGNNTTVTGPDGQPLVVRKRSWWRGNETQVDGNRIFDNIRTILNN